MMETCGVTTGDGTSASPLRFYLYAHLFAPWAGVLPGSLLYAATYVLLWIPPMAFLYRRRFLGLTVSAPDSGRRWPARSRSGVNQIRTLASAN